MTRSQKLRDVAEHVGSRRDVHDTVCAFVAVVSDATAVEIARLSTKSIDEVRAVLRGMRNADATRLASLACFGLELRVDTGHDLVGDYRPTVPVNDHCAIEMSESEGRVGVRFVLTVGDARVTKALLMRAEIHGFIPMTSRGRYLFVSIVCRDERVDVSDFASRVINTRENMKAMARYAAAPSRPLSRRLASVSS